MELHVWEIPVLRDIDHILSDQAVERVYTEGVDYDYWRRERGDLVFYKWVMDDRPGYKDQWIPTPAMILVHGAYLKMVEKHTEKELVEMQRVEEESTARHAEAVETGDKLTEISDSIDLQAHSYCPECLVDLKMTDHTATCETGKLLRRGEDIMAGKQGIKLSEFPETNRNLLGLNVVEDTAPIATNNEIFGDDAVMVASGENKVIEALVIEAEPDDTEEKKTVLVVEPPKTIVTLPPTGTESELNKVLDKLTEEVSADEDAIEVELAQRAAEREKRARELGDTGHNQFQDVKAGKADFDHGAI